MRTGQRNRYFTWQYETIASDSMGGFTATWVDACSVWAAMWPISGKEQVKTGQVAMEITHRIRVVYRSDIKPSWRGKYGHRYFNIVSIINPQESNIWLDLLCKEEFAK